MTFGTLAVKDQCAVVHETITKALGACNTTAAALRRAVADMRKLRKSHTKQEKLRKKQSDKDKSKDTDGLTEDAANKVKNVLQGRTNLAKAVNISDPPILQSIKDILSKREMKWHKDPSTELTCPTTASRCWGCRKGRNIARWLVKEEYLREVFEKTVENFRSTLVASSSSKAVTLVPHFFLR